MNIDLIEQKYSFVYPKLYKLLEQDGMLDVGEYGPSWSELVLPKLKNSPTLLLHTYDFELLSLTAVDKIASGLYGPDSWRVIDSRYKFIPFAQSGAGDLYCFLPSAEEEGEIPIVLFFHDSDEAVYLARNLQDFIFKSILLDMSDQDTYNEVSDDEFRSNLTAVFKTHFRYLSLSQTTILTQLFEREIKDYDVIMPNGRKEPMRGFLAGNEALSIVAREVPYEKMDETFVCIVD